MSEDPKQEFLSDGITEEIITALSKVHHLFGELPAGVLGNPA
jgi:TolB-like protein